MLLPKRKKDSFLSPSHEYAPKQEVEIARRVGGNIVLGSGCGYEKGDVQLKGIARIEAKCTKNKSFSITRKLVEKIEGEALQSGEIPAFQIDFLTDGKAEHQIAVIPVWALELLLQNQGDL